MTDAGEYDANKLGVMRLLSHAPEVTHDPQLTYKELADKPPAVRVDGLLLVRDRETVYDVLKTPDVFSSGLGAINLQTERPIIPLMIDPPDHRKYRKLLDPLFSPQRMKALEEPITKLVNDLIDDLIGEDEIDFTQRFSVPFPSQVFLALLGLPQDGVAQFLTWKDGIMHPDQVLNLPGDHPDVLEHRRKTGAEIYAYFEALLKDRDRTPGDDAISYLLELEVEGDKLSHEEILDTCFTLFNAGLDTVSASLDCFFAYLAQHPADRQRLVDEPEITSRAVEELLRWETPVMNIARTALEDTTVAGCPVHKGDFVFVMLGGANLDPDEFPEPYTVDLNRTPNRHLSFGGGIHRCVGSHLARIELEIALREWHRRIPSYELSPGTELAYLPIVRGLESLPLVLGPGRS